MYENRKKKKKYLVETICTLNINRFYVYKNINSKFCKNIKDKTYVEI